MPTTKLTIFQSDGTTAAIDYRTEATIGSGRQVVVLADPSITNNVAAVTTQDISGANQTSAGILVRMGGSISIGGFSGSAFLTGIYNSIGVNVGKIDGTIQVNVGKIDDSVKVVNITGGTLAVNVGTVADVVSVKFVSVSGTAGVNIGKQDGTLSVKLDPGSYALVNAFHTASIFNTSSTYTGNSASGLTLISPSANASFKIFAFSLSTTAQSNIFAKFTNGAGTSPTEYWRVALQAPAQGISGANLAVTPPGHLWATGVSTTLALVLDSASLVHYSVSYVKESA